MILRLSSRICLSGNLQLYLKEETNHSLEEEDPQSSIDEFLQDSIDILEQNIYS